MKKKGQAAMEFLMTYGWAILVVLIAISALAYFGVLNPSRFLPESCTLVPGLSCVDHKATSNSTTLVIQNGMGQDLQAFSVNADCTTPSNVTTFSDSDQLQFNITGCSNGAEDARLKKDVIISFRSEAGLDHTEKGQLVTKVE